MIVEDGSSTWVPAQIPDALGSRLWPNPIKPMKATEVWTSGWKISSSALPLLTLSPVFQINKLLKAGEKSILWTTTEDDLLTVTLLLGHKIKPSAILCASTATDQTLGASHEQVCSWLSSKTGKTEVSVTSSLFPILRWTNLNGVFEDHHRKLQHSATFFPLLLVAAVGFPGIPITVGGPGIRDVT